MKIVAECHKFTALPTQMEKLPTPKLDYVDGQCGVIWLMINMVHLLSGDQRYFFFFLWSFSLFFLSVFIFLTEASLSQLIAQDKPKKVQAKLISVSLLVCASEKKK